MKSALDQAADRCVQGMLMTAGLGLIAVATDGLQPLNGFAWFSFIVVSIGWLAAIIQFHGIKKLS